MFNWYQIDYPTMLRVFQNLINNSIKANSSLITINGYYKNGHANIDFKDNGKGIPKGLQPYILDRGTSSSNSNSGLGLNYAKNALNKFNTKILLEDSNRDGTVFKIRSKVGEIVLIDDNPIVLDTWTTIAKKKGLQLKGYATSKEIDFKNILKTTPIFIDHDLGDEDGLNVAQRLLKLGFNNVTLATGKTNRLHPQIQQIGKEFPCL